MKEKDSFPQIPHLYSMCLNEKCSQADSCLRQIAAQNIPENIEWWRIVSPKHLATLKGACPYYQSNKKIRLAKGFIQILDSLPYKQMQKVASHLIEHFNRRTYYRLRKGERLLLPSEQKQFRNILKRCGVNEPFPEFDAYLEEYDWYSNTFDTVSPQ